MKKSGIENWLVYPYSLTERLIDIAGDASLEVIAQGWEPACAWDRIILNDSSDRVWRREISMSAEGHACWYARTMVPELTYTNCRIFFDQLKTKSLGMLIFNSLIVERTSLAHYAIDESANEYQWLPEALRPIPPQILWARLSHLMLHKQFPFYLVEILLPDAERYTD